MLKIIDVTLRSTLIKHSMVSCICGFSEYISFLLIFNIFSHLFLSHLISFIFATFLGFLLHSYFTFSIKKLSSNILIKFIFQCTLVLSIGYLLLKLLFQYFEPSIAKPFQLILTFFINYSFSKFFSFKL